MRRLVGNVMHRSSHEAGVALSMRDRLAIRRAIAEAPTPGMRAELMAIAERNQVTFNW